MEQEGIGRRTSAGVFSGDDAQNRGLGLEVRARFAIIVEIVELLDFKAMKHYSCSYVAPEAEVIAIGPCREVCQSPVGNLKFGDTGAAGGEIYDDDVVDGGTL